MLMLLNKIFYFIVYKVNINYINLKYIFLNFTIKKLLKKDLQKPVANIKTLITYVLDIVYSLPIEPFTNLYIQFNLVFFHDSDF